MQNQKEPTLEEYGLTASSYEDYRNQKKELEDSFDNFKKDSQISLEYFKNENSSNLNKYIFGPLSFLVAITGFIFLVAESNYFWLFLLFYIIILIIIDNIESKIEDKIIKPKKLEIDKKIELAQEEKNIKINIIKSKIHPFEDSITKYYENYLEDFFKENLYKKRSGSDKFEQSLADFSLMIEQVKKEIKVINNKMIFRQIGPYYHESYLQGRQINHNLQKEKKQLFNSFNNIKTKQEFQEKENLTKEATPIIQNTTQIKPIVEKPKQIYEHDYLNKYIKDKDNLDDNQNQKSEVINHNKEEINQITHTEENNKKKGFWAEIMDEVKGEIENGNTKTSVENNIEIVKPIENISPDKKYYTPRKIDWDNINKDKKITGLKGEEIVMEIEKNYLNSINMSDLADKVRHISKEDGDGAGYDILSFYPDGQDKYIEVKSTMKSSGKSFYLSQNELDFLKKNKGNACVYRIFNVNENEDAPYLKVYRADDILMRAIIPVQYIVKMD